MNIVLLNDDYAPTSRGGAAVVVSDLAEGLRKAGHDVTIITTVQDAGAAGVTDEGGLRIHRLYASYPYRLRAWLSLYNPQTVGKVAALLKDIRPDVVHAHNLHHHLSYACLSEAKKTGARVFLTAHDAMLFHYGKLYEYIDTSRLDCDPHPDYRISAWRQFQEYRTYYNPFRNLAIRAALKNLDGLFAVSAELQEALRQNSIAGAEVMHNAIDVEAWQAKPGEAEAFIAANGLAGKKIILCAGRLSELKGGTAAVQAMRIVRKKVPEAVLVAVGGKDYRAARGVPDDGVVLTDWMPHDGLRAALAASAVVLVPSLCLETFGLVALEAMACAKPVVATCFGGVKEVVADGATGFIVNPLDTEKTAARIVALLEDEALAIKMGSAGRERARSALSLEAQVRSTLERYRAPSANNSEG